MCISPLDPPAWSPSDIATVIIAAVAVVVSVASVVSTFLVHRLQGAIVIVNVRYHVDLRVKATYKKNAPDLDKEPKVLATSVLRKADEIYERFPTDTHYATSFLRVVATNAGRIDASVDSISYVNKAKKGIVIQMKDEKPFPLNLPAQTYIKRDYLYSEVRSHAGKKAKIRFVVELTNGKHVKSRWIRLREALSQPT
jgi:hypothetical protein